MAKGIIYVMTTVVPGLVKIGQTSTDQFTNRMNFLERNGYSNVTGLERRFAIEVKNYVEKEELLQDIFSKSRVAKTELFSIDDDIVVQLLSSFDGVQIYPETQTKEEVFEEATDEVEEKRDIEKVPNGIYYLSHNNKKFGLIEAKMKVEDGNCIVLKGSDCAPYTDISRKQAPYARKNANIIDDKLQEDVYCDSPSIAGWVVLGNSNNGWLVWKNSEGKPIDIYRKSENK